MNHAVYAVHVRMSVAKTAMLIMRFLHEPIFRSFGSLCLVLRDGIRVASFNNLKPYSIVGRKPAPPVNVAESKLRCFPGFTLSLHLPPCLHNANLPDLACQAVLRLVNLSHRNQEAQSFTITCVAARWYDPSGCERIGIRSRSTTVEVIERA